MVNVGELELGSDGVGIIMKAFEGRMEGCGVDGPSTMKGEVVSIE